MTASLKQLFELEYFTLLEYHFALTAARICNETNPNVLLGAALALSQSRRGHLCADLNFFADKAVTTSEGDTKLKWPPLSDWLYSLRNSKCVSFGEKTTPLVLDNKFRLYLHRHYTKEVELAQMLHTMNVPAEIDFDDEALEKDLTKLFGRPSPENNNGQRKAVETSVRRKLSIITGGPGSGKTTTVIGVLLLNLYRFYTSKGYAPKIKLLAPTGKAARRLGESVKASLSHSLSLLGDNYRAIEKFVPQRAYTVHKLLNTIAWEANTSPTQSKRILGADLIILDEASMADLSLMHDLLSRIKPDTKVVIVGDKDQLASVESGAVLADIFDASCAATPNLDQASVRLTGSFRFDSKGGIGRLARAVTAGDAEDALNILQNDPSGQVGFYAAESDEKTVSILLNKSADDFSTIFKNIVNLPPHEALKRLGKLCVLTPHRTGPVGQYTLNSKIENMLTARKILIRDQKNYPGRPVMVTKNDYNTELFNGDTGIVVNSNQGISRKIAFTDGDTFKLISSVRLTEIETVFAITVHKSQGSEYDNAYLIIPETQSPVMVRELLYTAITRAKQKLTVIGSSTVFRKAVQFETNRASGLKDRLLETDC